MADLKVSQTIALTTAFQSVYANTVALNLTVSVIRITNVTAAPVTVSLCQVPAGGTPDITNASLWLFSLPANDFMEFGEGDIVLNGATLQAKAGANNAIVLKLSATQQ